MRDKECKQLKQRIAEYLDGELSDRLCQELERHLEDCEDCRIVINTFKKTIELCKASQTDNALPENIRQRLFQCLDLQEYLEDGSNSNGSMEGG